MSSPMSTKAPATRSATGNNRQAPVVRQLKPPPEIWELVHPVTTAKPKPIRSFLSRVVSSWTVLVFLAFVVGIGAGVGLALWKHPAAKAFFANPQKPVEVTTQQQPVVTETAPAPVQPSSTTADNPAAPPAASTETQPTATARTPEVAASSETQPAANESSSRPIVRRGILPRQPRTPDAALGVRVGSPSSASSERPTESAKSPERKTTDSAAPKPKSNTDGSQVITPAKPAPASKAKVIQWP
jgi:type IV secretory pathway VirB10-like protein